MREFIIPVTHETIEIAKGIAYEGWTFGGTVPGPTIRVREGDLVRITFVNDAPMPHSIDFHSARIAPNVAYRTIMKGDTVTFEFTATLHVVCAGRKRAIWIPGSLSMAACEHDAGQAGAADPGSCAGSRRDPLWWSG